MTGLEKIIEVIEADSKANIEKIMAEANEETEKILSLARKEAKEKCAEISAKTENQVKIILNRAQSGANLIKRQMILEAKLKMINEIIDKAKSKLSSLSNTDYFNTILQIIKKHAHPQEGIIIFSEYDLKRIPNDFEKNLENTLKDIKNAALTISKEAAPIDGGFILVYGDIEENCSFKALFNNAKEELQDKVNAFLFQ